MISSSDGLNFIEIVRDAVLRSSMAEDNSIDNLVRQDEFCIDDEHVIQVKHFREVLVKLLLDYRAS